MSRVSGLRWGTASTMGRTSGRRERRSAALSAFGLKNAIEQVARYDLAQVCLETGGFAQARHQLETILQSFPAQNSFRPLKYVGLPPHHYIPSLYVI